MVTSHERIQRLSGSRNRLIAKYWELFGNPPIGTNMVAWKEYGSKLHSIWWNEIPEIDRQIVTLRS